MKKKSFLFATAAGVSMFLASCAGTCDSEGIVELSNGYGLTKANDNYYLINPDSMKEFRSSDLNALIKDKKAIEIDKARLAKINEITSSIEVLV